MNARPFDLLSFGEALVDLLPAEPGRLLRHVSGFSPRLGGAPANLAFGAAHLGARVAFLSKLGQDEFGHLILERLTARGVDTSAVAMTRAARTGLTFVQIAPDGDRSFLFYRSPSADMTLTCDDIDVNITAKARIINTGTNLLMTPSTRAANLAVLDAAQEHGCLVTMDANLRAHLWADPSAIPATTLDALTRVHLLKVNDEEHLALFGARTPREAFDELLQPRGVRALVVTHDARGATVITARAEAQAPAPQVPVLDTTGAGDAFLAGLIFGLLRAADAAPAPHTGDLHHLLDTLEREAWSQLLTFACVVGSAVCTGLGATDALPSLDALPWQLLPGGAPAPSAWTETP